MKKRQVSSHINGMEDYAMKHLVYFLIAFAMIFVFACENGDDGRDGRDGRDGTSGTNGADGEDGEDAPVTLSHSEKASEEEARENCGEDIVNANWICTGVDENGNGYLDDYEFAECHIECAGAPGHSALVEKQEVTEEECSAGGFRLLSGIDSNDNEVLDSEEVLVDELICNGEDGEDGIGDAVRVSDEPIGTNCPNGGKKIERGPDTNRNEMLDVSEVASTHYVCNGIDGDDGHNAVTRTAITNDPLVCASGSGVIFESGTDDNDDDVLNDAEVSTTNVICDGVNGQTTRMTINAEPAGENCAVGGFSITYGVDTNDNGVLDDTEQSPLQFICHGQDGYSIVMRVTADTAVCSWNGYRLQFGADLDRDGALDAFEETSDFYICNGADGHISRINISDEPIGTNCPAGGKRIDTGMDINRDGLLNDTEVTTTNYVCNGIQGPQGDQGYNALTRITPDTSGTCAWGGYFLEVGTDISEDWILDPSEVNDSAYICNGIDGKTCRADITDEPAGTTCPFGGKRLDSGCDDDYNGTLDLLEITATDYICNGETGAIGPAGHDALTNMTLALSGCPNGGYIFTAGTDLNDDQILDLTEVTVTNLICHGVNGSDGYTYRVSMTDEPIGTNCPQGGKAIVGGLDLNRNGVLDISETDDPVYVCNGENGLPGINGQDGVSMAYTISTALLSECPGGGEKMEVGLDSDYSNTLDPSEIQNTVLICDGVDGANGHNSLTVVTLEPLGANCAKGGFSVVVGIDTDDNGVLDVSEAGIPQYVCHGLDGINGTNGIDGHNALAIVTTSTLGFCPNGGSELRTGTDIDDNGTLDAGEVMSFALICNGQNGANGHTSRTMMVSEPSGVNCSNGGYFITTGVDTDDNGALDFLEIQYSGYICHGINGNPGSNSVPRGRLALVSECTYGGSVVEIGTDSNNNSVLDDPEVMTTSYLCNGNPGADGQDGTDGVSYRVIVTNEPSGVNCQAGGKKVEGGYDTNGNNVLDPLEIIATDYICNGMDGQDGQDGMNALLRMDDEPAGLNCERGGKKILTGFDLDSDDYLDDVEVLSESYLCNSKVIYTVGAESAYGTFTAYTASTVSYCKMYGTTLEAVAYISDAGNSAVVGTDWDAIECFNASHVRVNITTCTGSGFTLGNVPVCTHDGSVYARGGLGQTCKPNRACDNGNVCRLLDTTCITKPVPGAGEYAFYWDGTMNSGQTSCESYGGNYYSPVVGQYDITGVPPCNADVGDPVRELKFYAGCITDQSDFDTLDPAARHCTGPAYAIVQNPW